MRRPRCMQQPAFLLLHRYPATNCTSSTTTIRSEGPGPLTLIKAAATPTTKETQCNPSCFSNLSSPPTPNQQHTIRRRLGLCPVAVDDDCKMQHGSARPSSQPVAAAGTDIVDVPGRPDFVNVFQSRDRPIPPTAVPVATPEQEPRTTRPDTATVYLPAPPPEMRYYGRCFAYAYITPATAACKADPAPVVRRAIHGAAPRARFELQGPSHGADRTVRFASPDDREAAMAKQPFALDDGVEVRLVREGETSNVAHVALLRYPKEQRNLEDVRRNSSSFGHLVEVDPECYDEGKPDLSPVRVVVNMQHPREIPREVRIRYADFRSQNVVPVQILAIWDKSQSTDADGKYVPLYSAAAVAAP